MPIVPDAPFDAPLIHDAFDFSRYPNFKTRNAKPITIPDRLEHRIRGRILFTSRGLSPSKGGLYQRPRNVSEPQLISSTNYMRESWFKHPSSAHTVGDISSLSSDDEICVNLHSGQCTTASCSTDDIDLLETPHPTCDNSFEISGYIEVSDYKSDDDSLYSMDSADQDTHPLLLSMPVIPQIRLERKATIREPDSLSVAAQNQTFLSPRIPDLRTPARMSSRRYGRILSAPTVVSDAPLSAGAFTLQGFRRFGSIDWNSHAGTRIGESAAYKRSVSESVLNSPCTLDDEQAPLLKNGADESLHPELLSPLIDEGGSTLGLHSDSIESGIEQLSGNHAKGSHQQSSLSHSISFSSIVHAVVDGCVSLDLFLRKPRTRLKPLTESTPVVNVNAHDPTSKWAPKDGRIIIKVFVPSTDDIWTFRVPQDISLVEFTSTVVIKLGFVVFFSGSVWDEPTYYFRTDERFKSWVKGRIRFGRNLPIVAHVLAPPPLVRLSVDAEGCEVWCYTW